MKMAFQRGGRTGIWRPVGAFGAWLDRGPYSHTEIVLSNGVCCTAEAPHGVVMREREMPPEHWDFLELPDALEDRVIGWYEDHLLKPYDYTGNLRFLSGLVSHQGDAWFCTESNLAALGVPQPWRHGPNGAYVLVKHFFQPGTEPI